jgi:hypothetical protein
MTIRVSDCEQAVHAFDGPEPAQRHVTAHDVDRVGLQEVVEKLEVLRKRTRLGGLPWKELRDEGRP